MIPNPNTTNWQVSLADPLQIVENAEEIAQCIYTILTTVRGSDPLRPAFGSEVFKFIDRPMNVAKPGLIYEVFSAIEMWERRIRVTRVFVTEAEMDKLNINIEAVVIASAAEIAIQINV